MKFIIKKYNTNLVWMKTPSSKGFTLIETLIAVFILTLAVSTLLNLTATSLFASRYARNEITANYLLQEAIDSIRNDRDTIAFQQNDPIANDGWNTFLEKYSTACLESNSRSGCYIEPADATLTPAKCASLVEFGRLRCPMFNYDESASSGGFYTYKRTGTKTNFKRQIVMRINPNREDELDVRVTVEWLNGTLVRTRSLNVSLLNWQQN